MDIRATLIQKLLEVAVATNDPAFDRAIRALKSEEEAYYRIVMADSKIAALSTLL